MNKVAIIGGGFCGTLTAINLVRFGTDALRVTIVNSRYPPGRGVAYSTLRPEHLLNVVARNMSAFPDLPSHFVDWLRNRADFAGIPLADLREQFVPRRVYGDYLQDLLFWQSQPLVGPGRVQIDLIDDEAVDIAPDAHGAQVVLKSGHKFEADRVILATGNFAPTDLTTGPELDHPAYRAEPWHGWEETLPDPSEDVLIVGTGLTMIDVFLTLHAIGWEGRIFAVSRNGLLPLPHFKGYDYALFPPSNVDAFRLRDVVALLDEHCARLRADGMNPALLVDKLRPATQRIWRNFTIAERREFSERYRTMWNVVRHRIPPAVAGRIDAAQKENRLHVLKGRLQALGGDGERIRITIDEGDGMPPRELVVGLLVNCTGPRESVKDAPVALFQKLLERGLIRPDELDMGIEVTPDFAVVDDRGRPSDCLFAIGSLLKGTLWETTAVPELRAQAQQVAKTLLADGQRQRPEWARETPENIVEYYI